MSEQSIAASIPADGDDEDRGCDGVPVKRMKMTTTTQRNVRFGPRDVVFPSPELLELTPRNDLLDAGDFEQLRQHVLSEEGDGFAFLRGVIPRHKVLAARSVVLDHFADHGGVLDPSESVEKAVLHKECGLDCVPFMEGKNGITHSDVVLSGVLESEELRSFFAALFGCPVCSFDYKWLRGVPTGVATGAHVDRVYMGRGTERLLTCWIPFGDNPVEMGSLAVLEGSHRRGTGGGGHSPSPFAKFQATYGSIDTEGDGVEGSGWFCTDPREVGRIGGQWRTADFAAGDVIVFCNRLVHMSTANTSKRVRISTDVRWQPKDDPADPRYVGQVNASERVRAGLLTDQQQPGRDASTGSGDATTKVTMAQLKERWGLA